MTKHFLCCIPVRVAVFVTSLLSCLFAGLVAAGAFFVLIKNKQGDSNSTIANLKSEVTTALWIVGGIYTLVALVSLFGFIGSVIRKRSFVALYSTMTYVFFLLEAGTGGYLIYSLFHDNGLVHCTVPEANGTTGSCKDALKNSRVFIIISLVVQLLLQLYMVVVIRRYVHQLDEEQSYSHTSGHVDSAFKMAPTNTSYYPHQPLDQGHGLLAPQGHYPYSDPHHSFGKQ